MTLLALNGAGNTKYLTSAHPPKNVEERLKKQRVSPLCHGCDSVGKMDNVRKREKAEGKKRLLQKDAC